MGNKVFVINPGSTSTKVALFEDDRQLWGENIQHDTQRLKEIPDISDQLPYRLESIRQALDEGHVSLDGISAVAGRGGGFQTVEGGTYQVSERMIADARAGLDAQHPANLGCQLAQLFAQEYGVPAFVANPPNTDELQTLARITGLKGVYRKSKSHVLNQKECCIRVAKQLGKQYAQSSFIVAHIGGGISVSAHKRGRVIDSNDIVNGDGPMSPTRSGALPALDVVSLCYSGKYTEAEMRRRITRGGGLIDHLGTADVKEICARIESGDGYAQVVFQAMLYQVAKEIGSCAAVLRGEFDGIILTGGIVWNKDVQEQLKEYVGFLGPIWVMPGELEMEALASAAERVLNGEEEAKQYTGEPVWTESELLKPQQ